MQASAQALWLEGADWLPTEKVALPTDLDFGMARELPRRWVNYGFEGWNGTCEIVWPAQRARLRLDADALFGRYFVFVSDPNFETGYNYEYFAFEPMSHSANAHNFLDGAGLRRLASAGSLSEAFASRRSWIFEAKPLRHSAIARVAAEKARRREHRSPLLIDSDSRDD